MRSDKLLITMINFLVPFILLDGFFVLADYTNGGFFSIIYATILVAIAFLIYSIKFTDLRLPSLMLVKLVSWVGLIVAIVYLTIILLLLIDLMPEIVI